MYSIIDSVNLKPLQDILEELGAKEFSYLLRKPQLEDSIITHNHTIFAPIDEAMKEYSGSFQESVSSGNINSLYFFFNLLNKLIVIT